MGSPANPADRQNSTYDWGGTRVRNYVHDHFPADTRVLDVGAGWGKYRDLLPEYTMDACEIWEPYVIAEHLTERYQHVYCTDVMTLVEHPSRWDLVIFGDVLEHLTRPQAQQVIRWAPHAVVVVPFRYPQGEEDGNPYEKHWQADLTPDLMARLYPELTELDIEWHRTRPFKGLYVKE